MHCCQAGPAALHGHHRQPVATKAAAGWGQPLTWKASAISALMTQVRMVRSCRARCEAAGPRAERTTRKQAASVMSSALCSGGNMGTCRGSSLQLDGRDSHACLQCWSSSSSFDAMQVNELCEPPSIAGLDRALTCIQSDCCANLAPHMPGTCRICHLRASCKVVGRQAPQLPTHDAAVASENVDPPVWCEDVAPA